MLRKIELEFLKYTERFNADYSRVLRHRIKAKTIQIHDELSLLDWAGLGVTENCNSVTEFCNGQQNQQGLNHVAFIGGFLRHILLVKFLFLKHRIDQQAYLRYSKSLISAIIQVNKWL